jgi:hypothetical protein
MRRTTPLDKEKETNLEEESEFHLQ